MEDVTASLKVNVLAHLVLLNDVSQEYEAIMDSAGKCVFDYTLRVLCRVHTITVCDEKKKKFFVK